SGLEDTPERCAALEKDPVVGVVRGFKPEARPRVDPAFPLSGPVWRLQELLPELARTYGVNFISDSYGSSSPLVELPPGGQASLYRLLDRCARLSHDWDHRGNLVRLRSRTWFLDRPAE